MLPTWHSRACCYTRALSVLKRAVTFLSPFLREISLREGELPNISASSAKRQSEDSNWGFTT